MEAQIQDQLEQLESQLGQKISTIERFPNKYGMSTSLYKLGTPEDNYFLKIYTDNRGAEHNGYMRFTGHIPTPLLRARIEDSTSEFLVFDFLENADMLCDMVQHAEATNSNFEPIYRAEEAKNTAMRKVYEQTPGVTTFEDYMQQPVNRLFANKLLGSTFNSYYGTGNPINPLLNAQVRLNGYQFDRTGQQILSDLQRKLSSINSDAEADSISGHGDLHHMNVLYTPATGPQIIDFEYSSTIPIGMEMAKPYYIDFIGTLFFFFQEQLESHFRFSGNNLAHGLLDLQIEQIKPFVERGKITQSKINQCGNLIAQSRDFLTFNDYLLMCHALSHNPNYYRPETQLLFTAMIPILAEFNYNRPNDLFRIFN